MGDRWDGLRGDLDLVRSMEHERVSMSTDEASALLAERDALAAEVERLRPVLDALTAWDDAGDYCPCHDNDPTMEALLEALTAYRYPPAALTEEPTDG